MALKIHETDELDSEDLIFDAPQSSEIDAVVPMEVAPELLLKAPDHHGDSPSNDPSRSTAQIALETAIRRAVIPRLYARHSEAARLPARNGLATGDIFKADGSVDHMLRLVLSGRTDAQRAFLTSLCERSVPLRVLVEHIIVPVANEIGRAWVDDRMSFAEVTITIGQMQKVVADFTAHAGADPQRSDAADCLVAPVPGDQHSFGAAVLADLLNDEGVRAECILEADTAKLCERVAAKPFLAIAISCNSDRTLQVLPALIGKLRCASLNPDAAILIGGWALQPGDDSLHDLGADLVVTDRSCAIDAIVSCLKARRRDSDMT